MDNLVLLIPSCVLVIGLLLFLISYYVLFQRDKIRLSVGMAYFSIVMMGIATGTLIYRGGIALLSSM